MDIVNNIKDISSDFEHGIKEGLIRTKNRLTNVAGHLPFINLAKNRQSQHTIEIDLPGVDKQDIDLTIQDNVLTVSAERRMKKEVKEEHYYHLSSYFGKILRSFTLPEAIDKESITAEYKNGRLYIRLNEHKQQVLHQVPIK